MTISLKVTVSGNYKATIKHKINGEDAPTVEVNGATGEKNAFGSVEGSVYFQHGATNDYSVTEESLGEKPATSDDAAASA